MKSITKISINQVLFPLALGVEIGKLANLLFPSFSLLSYCVWSDRDDPNHACSSEPSWPLWPFGWPLLTFSKNAVFLTHRERG